MALALLPKDGRTKGWRNIHHAQTHEGTDGDLVLERQGQVPDHSDREKGADNVGKNRDGCYSLACIQLTMVADVEMAYMSGDRWSRF